MALPFRPTRARQEPKPLGRWRAPGYTRRMRHWLFHPLLFYPLALLAAALVIVVSLEPQAWPRDPAPVVAERDGQWLVFQGEAFNSPAVDEQKQEMTVARDFFGRAQTLSIAQKPSVPAPTPEDQGVRILLSAEDSAALSGRPVTVEVSYNPLPINAATAFAVSLQGEGPTTWVAEAAPPQPATVRFQLPAQASVNAIGLRAISDGADQAYGLEITRIRVAPHA